MDHEDVWRDEEPSETTLAKFALKNQGYLDGLTVQKNKSVQIGFDEGYPAGADVGYRVGYILGTLQALGKLEQLEVAKRELSKKRNAS